jgi:NAD-reducing hydrogenase large subunit
MHMGQTIQSHSMHFFELAGPDLILGFDADPAIRNVVGLVKADAKLALKAVTLRKFGQEIIATLGERKVHPNFAVPGGVNKALTSAERDKILAAAAPLAAYIQDGLAIFKGWMEKHQQEMDTFASFPTGYLGMVGPDNALSLYDGDLRLVDSQRRQIERFFGKRYLKYIGEHVESWSYLKFPFYKGLGWPDGVYRVGPLARLNAAEKLSTPLAQKEYEEFLQIRGGRVVEGSLYYHYARLIEDLYAFERAMQILDDPEILSKDLRVNAKITNHEGVGVIEAPRGTLWHHYWVDEKGQLEKVNLIVATGSNNYAMSRAVEEVAKTYINGEPVAEGALNRVEAAIRCYDPCLSCSTHAVGKMPMEMVVYAADGREVSRKTRA